MSEIKYKISIVGFLTVRTSPDGREITPRASKARGLIGLLALSPEYCRGRSWLQSKLWSDRGESQAQSSLRQAVYEIRRAFGENSDLIGTDREKIWLRQDLLNIDLLHNRKDALARLLQGSELMEGLTVRDEEFEDWLRLERSHVMSSLAEETLRQNHPRIESSNFVLSEKQVTQAAELEVARIVAEVLFSIVDQQLVNEVRLRKNVILQETS